MVDDMIRKFLQEDRGNVTVEYVIFVAAVGMVLIIGVTLLFNALQAFFASWAGYFATPSS